VPRIDADFAPTLGLLDRLRGWAKPLTFVIPDPARGLDDLAAQGKSWLPTAASTLARFLSSASRGQGPARIIPTSQSEVTLRATLGSAPAAWPIHGSAPVVFSSSRN